MNHSCVYDNILCITVLYDSIPYYVTLHSTMFYYILLVFMLQGKGYVPYVYHWAHQDKIHIWNITMRSRNGKENGNY